jgi:protein TonB
MTILISILVLLIIAGLLSSDLGWNNVVTSQRNDLVFETRNKQYGAFQIRRDYNGIIILALLSTIGLAAGLSVGMRVLNSNKALMSNVPPPLDTGIIFRPPPIDKPIVQLPPPPTPTPPPVQRPLSRELAFTPQVTEDEVAKPPHSQEDMTNAKPGNHDSDNPDPGDQPETPNEDPGKGVVENPDAVYAYAEEDPSFIGGEKAMMDYLRTNINFPNVCRDRGVEGIVNVQFVVDKTGAIKNVIVQRGVKGCKEYEKEAIRVVSSMPVWKPGKMNGKSVSVMFSIPVSFKIGY